MTKREIRAQVRAACPDAEVIALESQAICGHILQLDAFQQAKTIAAYCSLQGEADIRPLLEEILQSVKTLLLPRTERDLTMRFLGIKDLSLLTPDAWGIPSPPEDAEETDPDQIDLMLLPLCAVDRAGNRLGKGGGCYDRWLAGHPSRALRIGIALRHQRVDTIPADPWDTALDACAFPEGITRYHRINRQRETMP